MAMGVPAGDAHAIRECERAQSNTDLGHRRKRGANQHLVLATTGERIWRTAREPEGDTIKASWPPE